MGPYPKAMITKKMVTPKQLSIFAPRTVKQIPWWPFYFSVLWWPVCLYNAYVNAVASMMDNIAAGVFQRVVTLKYVFFRRPWFVVLTRFNFGPVPQSYGYH